MRYLALYNPTTKKVDGIETYLETSISEDGENLYKASMKRFFYEAKNRGTPWNNYDDTATFSSKNAGYTGDEQPNSILLIGDSRTFLWPAGKFSSYTTVDNRGIGGDTAVNQAETIPTWSMGKFEKAVISIGVNDKRFSAMETITALSIIISHIKQHAQNIYLTSIPSITTNLITVTGVSVSEYEQIFGHLTQTNLYIQQLCINHGINYINLAGLMNEPSTSTLKAIYDDGGGIHFNAAGYTAIRNLYATSGI